MIKYHNFDQISQFRPNFIIFTNFHNFTISTKFHNFDKLSQFWPNITILTKYHNFNQISQFRLNFTIFTNFHNFDQISQFRPNFTKSTKLHNYTNFTSNFSGSAVCNFVSVLVLLQSVSFTAGERIFRVCELVMFECFYLITLDPMKSGWKMALTMGCIDISGKLRRRQHNVDGRCATSKPHSSLWSHF